MNSVHADYDHGSSDPNAFASLGYTSPYSTSEASEGTNPLQAITDEGASSPPPAAKRKRENRYKNAPPGVLSRRRAQNRASQRAYRERKEQRIRDLEQLLQESQQRQESLSQAYISLQSEYERIRAEQQHQGHHLHDSPVSQHAQIMSSYSPYPVSGPGSTDLMATMDLSLGMSPYPPTDIQQWRRGT